MKQNLTRNIALTFRVNEEERELIRKAMKLANVTSLRPYLLKLAINGRIVNVEMDSIAECNRLLSNISNNINQISKRANQTGNLYAADFEEIKTRQDEIWEQQDKIIRLLTKVVEVA
jgi:uncharacterized protein (DUF1778 family)